MQTKKVHHLCVGDIDTNCWIYPLEQTSGFSPCAVIDPAGKLPDDEGNRIIARLDQLKLFPAYILLTHGHFDHIGAVPALAAEYGKRGMNCEIAIHAADAEYLGPDAYAAHYRTLCAMGINPAYIGRWKNKPLLPNPSMLLAEGDRVGPFTVLHVPGHTPGSIALWDQEAGNLFSGDTLFRSGYGRTDLPGGSAAQLFASLKRLFAMDGDIQVFPGHGPATLIKREKPGSLL